jgi:hypothetical protein
MLEKEFKKKGRVYKVQTFGTLQEGLKTEKMLYEDVLAGIRLKLKNATRDEGDAFLVYGTGIPIGDPNLGHD